MTLIGLRLIKILLNNRLPQILLPRSFNPNFSGDQSGGSFRLQNELMPQNLRVGEPGAGPSAALLEANLDDINPMGNQGNQVRSEVPKPMQYPSDLNLDFKSASLEDLLREVELLELPEFATPLNIPDAAAIAQPMPVVPSGTSTQASRGVGYHSNRCHSTS